MADNAAQLPGAPAQPVAPAPPIVPPAPAPGAAGVQQNIPAPARRDRAPRRDGLAPSTATVTGIPAMYSMVATAPFYTVQRKTISTFVPSFIAACVVINQMNFTMAYTHRFLTSAPAWSPFMTPLYIGILWIIQTLRAQREAGAINTEELQILEALEHLFDLRSLLVPGPLVPYLQALAAFCGPFERSGDVTPRLPTTYPTAASGYVFADGLHKLLPNIPFYMHMLTMENPTFTASTDGTSEAAASGFANIMKYFLHSIHSRTASNTGTTRHNLESPGSWMTAHFTEQQFNVSRSIRHHFGFPPQLDTSADGDMNSLAQFMRMYQPGDYTVFYNWFGNVASVMQRYCQFFRESVPLSAISPAGIASGLPVWNFAANANLVQSYTHHNAVAATATTRGYPAYFSVHHLTSLAATGHHVDESLEEITEQASSLAMVNVDVVTHTTWTTPTNAHIRSGPVWNLEEVRSSPQIDYANAIGQTISLHYHVDTRQT